MFSDGRRSRFRNSIFEHFFKQNNIPRKNGILRIIGHRSFPAVGRDLPPLVIMYQIIPAEIDALIYRIETDGLGAKFVDRS